MNDFWRTGAHIFIKPLLVARYIDVTTFLAVAAVDVTKYACVCHVVILLTSITNFSARIVSTALSRLVGIVRWGFQGDLRALTCNIAALELNSLETSVEASSSCLA